MSTRKNVLKLLEENRGIIFSGQDIANRLSISRSSVWKAVRSLQKDGLQILAKSGTGYFIPEYSNNLTVEGIRANLSESLQSLSIFVFDEIDSTNLEAKKNEYVQKGSPLLIVANSQTEGRGRLGRSFFSPKDSGVYLSFAFKPRLNFEKSFLLTTSAAVAVCRAIEYFSPAKAQIKWVNDVYLDGKKVCGILTEGISSLESGELAWSVVGIGINCFLPQSGFPHEIKETAGAVFEKNGGGSFNRNMFVAKLTECLFEILDNLSSEYHMQEYKERSMILGKKVNVIKNPQQPDVSITAKAVDILDNGALLVEYENHSQEALSSGEVSLKL